MILSRRFPLFSALFVLALASSCRWQASSQLQDAINAPEDGVNEIDLGYDPGPDPRDPVGSGFLELINNSPNFAYIGYGLSGFRGHKFRYPFGTMPWRGPTRANSIKVLVIGQDGTHIAEAAGRPFTGGTGGRVQNALAYIGIRHGAMFINTFAFTIKGQYADYAPLLITRNGRTQVKWTSFLPPESYLLGQNPDNPIVKWRNEFLDQIIDSNRDSLKLIFCIGGAARDTLATYINSRGGNVPTWYSEEQIRDNVQAILYGRASAGGNRSFFYPLDDQGRNLLVAQGERRPDYSDNSVQREHQRRAAGLIDQMQKHTAGKGVLEGTGILHPAQLGYKLSDGDSIAGITIRGRRLDSNIRALMFRHPGSLSSQLEADFQRTFDALNRFAEEDRYPEPDVVGGEVMQNKHAAGIPFDYRDKPPIPQKDFPLGKTQAVIVNSSLASRSGKQVIVFGGRQRAFGRRELNHLMRHDPSEGVDSYRGTQPWNPARVQTLNHSEGADFDRGPGREWADLFRDVPADELFNSEAVISDKRFGAFGFFRGHISEPQVVIIADPVTSDLDDMYTARALSGGMGQLLHGFLQGLGVGEKYLVVKHLPFDMTGASADQWNQAMALAQDWRQAIVAKALAASPQLVLAVGPRAVEAIGQIEAPVVTIADQSEASFQAAFDQIQQQGLFAGARFQYQAQSIPRAHLPFPMQAWVGTSGTRGARATGRYDGEYYGIVAPTWVVDLGDETDGAGFPREKEFLQAAAALVDEHGFANLGSTMRRHAEDRGGGRDVAAGELQMLERQFEEDMGPMDDSYFDRLNEQEQSTLF